MAEVFVGRDAELATLADQLARAADGKGRFVLISGEPGIGKTRLAEELSRLAEQRGHVVAWGRSWEGPGTPAYWPWLQVLRALGIDDAITQASDQLDQHEARFRMFDAIAQRLVRAAAARPIAIVLDDVHAADLSTLLLLHFVARTVQRTRLLVIATSRDNWFHSTPQSSELLAKIAREALSLPLGRLGDEDVTRWVAAIAPQLASKTERVVHASEGNPLFVEELVAAARKQPDGAWTSSHEMPHGVREAVRAHLALLSPATADALAIVAVLGRDVSRSAATALVGNDVGAAIDEGVRLGVLIQASDDRVRFAHVLLRDELYGGLALDRRGELHRAIASTAEPAVAAHHYLLGARREDGAVALAAVYAAMEQATAQLALEDAAALGQRAVDVLAAYLEPDAACELHIAVSEACRIAGRLAPARGLSDRAIDLATALGDPTRVARATLVLSSMNSLGRNENTLRRLRGALALLPTTPSPLRAQLMGQLSTCMVPSPPHEAPEQIAMREQSIAMARELGDEPTLVTVLSLATLVFPELMPVAERLAVNRETLALSERLGRSSGFDASKTLTLHGSLVHNCLELGDLEGARAEVAAAERRITAYRQPNLQWRVPLLRAMLASLAGNFAEAAAQIDQAIELGKQHDVFEALLMAGISRSTMQYARGDDEGYAGYFELGLDTQLKAGAPGPYKAILYAAAFAVEKTRAALDFSIGVPVDVMPGSSMLAMAALRVGLTDHALRLYRVGREHFGRIAMVGAPSGTGGPTSLILGQLATLAGDHADAEQYFKQSLGLCEKLQARPYIAQTQLAWARLAAARGATDEARTRSEAARTLADSLGMHRVADQAATLSGAATTVRPTAPAPRSAPATLALAREGEMWSLSLGATSIRMVDSKGLAYLEILMRDPGREIHVLDLVGIESDGDAGPVLDAKSKQAYRARAQELKETLEEAVENNDLGRAEAAREELEALEEELARAVGLGGRDRRAVSQAERARINVQRRLRHLRHIGRASCRERVCFCVRSSAVGVFCSYSP